MDRATLDFQIKRMNELIAEQKECLKYTKDPRTISIINERIAQLEMERTIYLMRKYYIY